MEDQVNEEQSNTGMRYRVIGEVLDNVSVVVSPEIWERYFEPFAEINEQLVLLAMKFLPLVDQFADVDAKEIKVPFVAELNDSCGHDRVLESLQLSRRTKVGGDPVFLIESGQASTPSVEAGA